MIDALVAERDQFLDAYRRTAADFDNFRKLSQKRLADEVTRTQGSFVERLLPVLDAIDAARGHGQRDVEAVAGALFGFLEKEGLDAGRIPSASRSIPTSPRPWSTSPAITTNPSSPRCCAPGTSGRAG